jgi:hypothetical protein
VPPARVEYQQRADGLTAAESDHHAPQPVRVEDGDQPALPAQETPALVAPQPLIHTLARRRDHPRQFHLGGPHRDRPIRRFLPLLSGQLQQRGRQPRRHIVERRPLDDPRVAAQAAAHLGQQGDRRARVRFEVAQEGIARQDQQGAILLDRRVGRARLAIQQRQVAERVARPQHVQHHLAPIGCRQADPHPPALDQIELLPRIAGQADRRPARVAPPPQRRRQGRQILVGEPGEEGYPSQRPRIAHAPSPFATRRHPCRVPQ